MRVGRAEQSQVAGRFRARSTTSPSQRAVLAAIIIMGVLVLSGLPGATASLARPAPVVSCGGLSGCALAAIPATGPAPLHGLVKSCKSASTCGFIFNSSGALGWANASPPSLTLRLPGEALTSTNLAYSTYTASLIGTYTYWTVGNFVGTDVSTGKVVYGVTNTNFTITCYGHSGRGGGCTYVYTTDNGTIVVFFTQADQTTTTVACAPSSISPGSSSVCTARVNDSINRSATPSGNVSLYGSFGSTAGFSNGGNCALISGACSVLYTAPDDQLGTVPVTAIFNGTSSFYTSSGRSSIYVSPSGSGGGSSTSTVSFMETGLANGTAWTVTLGGLLQSSSSSSIPFVVQNGTYPFTVGAIPGYTVSPRYGNVTVSGDDVGINIAYAPIAYGVTFLASGLPRGLTWGVNLDAAVHRTFGGSVYFSEPNGTHSYLLTGPAGFRVTGIAPSGAITVAGGPVTRTFSFARGVTFAVVFVETGLPRSTSWCVILGTIACSSTYVQRMVNLTPATYPYSVLPMAGQVITAKIGLVSIPLSGNLTISTFSPRIALHYTYPYVLTFTETGLPTGTNWGVTVRGVTHSSTTNTIVFNEPNGTYYYRLGLVTGYLRSGFPYVGVVRGGPASVVVTYRL